VGGGKGPTKDRGEILKKLLEFPRPLKMGGGILFLKRVGGGGGVPEYTEDVGSDNGPYSDRS